MDGLVVGTIIGIGNTMYHTSGGGAISPSDPFNGAFVFTVEVTSPSKDFTIPCQNIGVFNANIEWGDGSADSTITTFDDADLAHTYAVAGTYTITVTGAFTNIFFNNTGDRAKVRTVLNIGTVGWLKMDSAFYGCNGLTEVASASADVSGVTTMINMFREASALTSAAVSSWDTSSVTSLFSMFRDSPALVGLDISQWDIASITGASGMLLSGPTLSVTVYDATLINWEGQVEQPNVVAHFGTSKYTAGGAAATARAALVSNGWTITDGGTA